MRPVLQAPSALEELKMNGYRQDDLEQRALDFQFEILSGRERQ